MKKKKSIRNSRLNSLKEIYIKSKSAGTGEKLDDLDKLEFNDVLPVERPKYICALCKKSFSDKNCLKKHIKKIHDVEPEPLLQNEKPGYKIAPFKCRVCETEFAYKRNLKRHLIKYHSQGLEEEEGGNCFCNVEGCKFRSFFINALRTHLTDEHKVQIVVENKTFSSKVEFDLWKEEEEKTNVCLFIKEAGKHTLINGDQRLIYQCHRSGHYSGHGFGKRSFRVKGTCKLGKRCTAGIELTVKNEGDIHEVVYYKTHLWHTPDVEHVNLSASERAFLANKLKEGASISSILESVKADKSLDGTNLCKRIHLLKRKDLVNIENTFRLNNTERHLKKQHKKGQKLDREKIKKNLDDYGEVVSWVVESPSNLYEYFTVKKLQTEKCLENCGVICVPCDACLHMYSCTCHDYLLFSTMCQHIHSVSLLLHPVQKCKRQISRSVTGNNGLSKRKRKDNVNPILKETNDTDNKETDIINFLTKNLELQREHELHQERIKLKEKIEFFNNLWASKIDQLNETSVQQLIKIIDSAVEIINGPAPTNQLLNNSEHMPATAITVQSNPVMTSCIAINNISHETHDISKQMTNMNPPPPVISISDRKYEIPPQYYSTIKKKRKIDETTFYKPPVMDKRPIYENITNDHSLISDNYATFDCSLSWQTPSISTGGGSVGKWWT